MPKSYSSSPSCIPVKYPREGRSPGRFMRLADRCFAACGTAATAPWGHQSAIPPFASVFRGARRKRSAVDGETWLNPSVTTRIFEYLGSPPHQLGRRNLVLLADW